MKVLKVVTHLFRKFKLQHMESLPTMDDLDNELTIEELSKAITDIASWKVPGSDGIPADFFRQCKSVYYFSYMTFQSNIGEKVRCHKICVMLRPCITKRVPDRIAITIGGFPCLVLLTKLLHVQSSLAYRNWPKEYILSRSLC